MSSLTSRPGAGRPARSEDPSSRRRCAARSGPAGLVLGAALLVSACGNRGGPDCPTEIIDTTVGELCGRVVEAENPAAARVEAFLGIPFAESTAGEGRWSPPVPKAPLSGVYQAGSYGPACPQPTSSLADVPQSVQSEDCLTVNVWRRVPGEGQARTQELKPVMVWIYGGSFTSGSTSVPLYDGATLAADEDVVVISLNYRVGALGFLAGISGLAGNYGLQDQQLALRWVRDNASRFGGDPARVMLFGESAGAMSVGLHQLSIPSSEGLFRAVLMQSNPLGLPYKNLAQATPISALLAAELHCSPDDLACLRGVPAADVVTAQQSSAVQAASLLGARLAGFLAFAPVVDGEFVVREPVAGAVDGGLDLPAMLGTLADEGTLFIAGLASEVGGTISRTAYLATLTLLFGPAEVPDIVALYGVNPTGDNSTNLSNIATDYLFGCPNRYVARQARSGLHAWYFTETSINLWPQVPQCAGLACHGDDLVFTFHSDRNVGITFDVAQAQLSDRMVGYWGSFTRNLDPNASGLPSWPSFSPAGLGYLQLHTGDLDVLPDPNRNCDFWDSIGYGNDSPFASFAASAATPAP